MKSLLINLIFAVIVQHCLAQSRPIGGNTGISMTNIVSADSSIFNYKFYNVKGELVTLNEYKGKIIFVDFWFTGCSACVGYYQENLKYVEKYYKGTNDVVFVSISIDRDSVKWLNTVENGFAIDKKGEHILRQTDPNGINLRCLNGGDSPVNKGLNIYAYPTLMLFDKNGKLITRSKQKLRLDGIRGLIDSIDLALQK